MNKRTPSKKMYLIIKCDKKTCSDWKTLYRPKLDTAKERLGTSVLSEDNITIIVLLIITTIMKYYDPQLVGSFIFFVYFPLTYMKWSQVLKKSFIIFCAVQLRNK